MSLPVYVDAYFGYRPNERPRQFCVEGSFKLGSTISLMESINLREACAGDVLPILELWRVTKSGPSVTDTPEHLQMLIDKMPDLFLVAESETRLAGSIIGGWDYWRAHIYRLAVHPDFRRLGLARRLTTEIEQRLRARGAIRIYALAGTKQEMSVKFWESLPYEKSKDIPYVRTFAE